jgi:predicted aspartyl protease
MVQGATLEIGNRKFIVNLIVIPGLVLDVIIGTNWMKDWGAVIDTESQVLTLKNPRVRVLSRYHCLGEWT